jgi:uncharacterized protein (DUF2252 family)
VTGLLTANPASRTDDIVGVLHDAFGTLIANDPVALRKKFRKMATTPFAFYRGSAVLFYADVVDAADPFADERTSRVWIQGDLHAQNYGTYMDAEGRFVFDVNDYDESYVGHFTWDVLRMGASLVLLGVQNALSDGDIDELIATYVRAYAEAVHKFATTDLDRDFGLRLGNTSGPLHRVLQAARRSTRVALLARDTTIEGDERVFRDGPGVRRLEAAERARVCEAFERYLDTIPPGKRRSASEYRIKDVVGRSGFGIGSAGLPAYNLLLEGHTEALENDLVISMKQANVAAPSRVVTDPAIAGYFLHHGHRTVVSQRALQAHADPWLGYTELGGVGQVVKELSPYEADLDWDDLTEPEEMAPVLTQLGAATAKIHCVADAEADETLVPFVTEEAIDAAISAGGGVDAFVSNLVSRSREYGEQARSDFVLFVDAFRNGRLVPNG